MRMIFGMLAHGGVVCGSTKPFLIILFRKNLEFVKIVIEMECLRAGI